MSAAHFSRHGHPAATVSCSFPARGAKHFGAGEALCGELRPKTAIAARVTYWFYLEGSPVNPQEVSPGPLQAIDEVRVASCGVQASLALNELMPSRTAAADLAVDVVGMGPGVAGLKSDGLDAAAM